MKEQLGVNQSLKTTLTKTQTEFDRLIDEHERVSRELKDVLNGREHEQSSMRNQFASERERLLRTEEGLRTRLA